MVDVQISCGALKSRCFVFCHDKLLFNSWKVNWILQVKLNAEKPTFEDPNTHKSANRSTEMCCLGVVQFRILDLFGFYSRKHGKLELHQV